MQNLRYTILIVLLVFLYISIELNNPVAMAYIYILTMAFTVFAWTYDYMSLSTGNEHKAYSSPNEPYGRTKDGIPITMPKPFTNVNSK